MSCNQVNVNLPLVQETGLTVSCESNLPAALYIKTLRNDYITGLSTHLFLSEVEVLNKYRREKKGGGKNSAE